MANLRRNLKTLRKVTGLSQNTVATQLGISRVAIARWESGTVYPHNSNLKKLSQLFGITTKQLLGEDEFDITTVELKSTHKNDADDKGVDKIKSDLALIPDDHLFFEVVRRYRNTYDECKREIEVMKSIDWKAVVKRLRIENPSRYDRYLAMQANIKPSFTQHIAINFDLSFQATFEASCKNDVDEEINIQKLADDFEMWAKNNKHFKEASAYNVKNNYLISITDTEPPNSKKEQNSP